VTANPIGSNRPVSLEDIAAKAGVSRSTVSRVINDEPYVSEKTRQRVKAVIEQEGFAPNPAARALVTQRSQAIGVVIPLVPVAVFENAYYFPTLLQGVSRVTYEQDYALLLWLAQAAQGEESFYRQVARNRLMDGVILASAPDDNPVIERLLEKRIPFVLVERPSHYYDRVNYVTVDNVEAAFEAVSHLINLGRQHIGTITGNLAIPDAKERLQGYRKALIAAGRDVDETLIVVGGFDHEGGYRGMQQLLMQKVDAVFAASDLTARGALQALHEAQIAVPDDIAVVGFDDLPTAVQVSPPLTTVRQPIEQKGAIAASILIDFIEGKVSELQQIVLPTQLVIRESCGALQG